LRAERKAGELFSRMERGEAGRPANGGTAGRNFSPYQQSLSDGKISERSARRWRQLADAPSSS
jgi:hypothetical protein